MKKAQTKLLVDVTPKQKQFLLQQREITGISMTAQIKMLIGKEMKKVGVML